MGAETWRASQPLPSRDVASMRPRHDGRGNPVGEHGRSRPSEASMRPRHDGRGNAVHDRTFLEINQGLLQ